jgi:SAM-dependent methyltransferase
MYKFLTFYVLPSEKQNKKIPIINTTENPYDIFYSNIYDDLFYVKERYQYEADIINYYLNSNCSYIDLCTGTGSLLTFLNIKNIIGIDKSKEMLKKALYKNKNKNIKFYNSDILNIDKIKTKESVDGIGCFYFGLFYNKRWENILYKLKNKIKNNGYLFLSVLDKNKLEVFYKKIKYKDNTLYYSAKYDNCTGYPFTIIEKIETDNYSMIYKHIMYNPTFDYFEKICHQFGYTVIKKIKYEMFSASDEYLYILQKKTLS